MQKMPECDYRVSGGLQHDEAEDNQYTQSGQAHGDDAAQFTPDMVKHNGVVLG